MTVIETFSRRLTAGRAAANASEFARIARFAGNGVFNTGLSYVLFLLCLQLGAPVFAALVLSAAATTLFNYNTSRLLVFRSKQKGLIIRFVLVYSVMLLLNCGALFALEACGVPSWLAQAPLVPPIAALAYVAQRNLVFNRA